MKRNNTLFAKIRNGRASKFLAAFLAINLLVELFAPSVAMALTAGAVAPEFSSFEPVATTDMVNDFTGDFTYNLPVLSVPGTDGGGYSMSLSYHSGASSEEEASWVGFGWTLNPGAINRQKRGYADDFKKVQVKTYNKVKPSWMQTATFSLNMELLSKDQQNNNKNEKKNHDDQKSKKKSEKKTGAKADGGEDTGEPVSPSSPSPDPATVSVSLSHTVRYNNYSGFSIANGFGVGVMGMANMNMNRSGGENTFGISVNPMAVMRAAMKNASTDRKNKFNKLTGPIMLYKDKNNERKNVHINNNILKSSYPIQSFNAPALSYSVAQHAGVAWNFSCSVQLNINIPVGFQFGLSGGFNTQAFKGENANDAYGYMYPGENNESKTGVVEDFSVEKETTFDKHDKNLGIPFNNADIFSATGNNVIGGFKFQHTRIGQYYPTKTKSEKKIRQLGVELGIGLTFQVGFDIGIGKQTTEVNGDWDKGITIPEVNENAFFSMYPLVKEHFDTWRNGDNNLKLTDYIATAPSNGDVTDYNAYKVAPLKYFAPLKPKMRFINDPGGELQYSTGYSDDDVQFATLGQQKNLDLHNFDLTLDQSKSTTSSFVDYETNGSLIGSMSVIGKDGSKNEYGLPVYVRNETELSIGVANKDGDHTAYGQLNCDNPMENETVTGQVIKEKYASTFLLTANKTFDYYDADKIDGPSDGDFGGWTKFEYRKAYGKTDADWYRYRAPYNGLSYNPGRVSDVHDQTGSMSSGEREVYYTKSIETKTHVAFFITNKTTAADFAEYTIPTDAQDNYLNGSGIDRNDGIDAAAIDHTTGLDPAAESPTAQGTHRSEKLERIVVFSKSDFSKPITTTFFEYDYSVCQGVLNNSKFNSSTAEPTEKGKLTLKRVWMESGGTIKSMISPYQFSYEYFNKYPDEIKNKYPEWAPAYNLLKTNDANQNPPYKLEELDPWGFYQERGAERFSKRQEWVSQKAPSATFDPAAWQLKRIQLPSGGEIHVNYEQKDYKYVQDKKPMAMISLLPQTFSQEEGYKANNTLFYINSADLAEVTDLDAYVAELKRYFLDEKNKLYYKVLYAYLGFDKPQINAQNQRFDYVTGYTTVNEVGIDNNKIFLRLGDKTQNNSNGYDGDKDKTLPRYVGYQNLLSNAGRNLGLNARNNYEDADPLYTGIAYPKGQSPTIEQIGNDLKDMARQHVFRNTIDMFLDWTGGVVKNVKKKDACRVMNEEQSYFKLPVLVTKKGGGMRVKRLISYDPGIAGETGGAMVYGSEYIYEDEHGYTSGVATNEPASAREDNSLVGFEERKKQKGIDRAMNGRDSKQFEGPMGETILPAASVVHERVVVRNIHSGKTTTGFIVNKYHTCHEYPMYATNSVLAKSNNTYKKFDLNLPLGLFNMDIHRAWVTQGYLFKQNDMNGKIASQASYPGNYSRSNFKEAVATTRTDYTYSAPGSTINTLVYDPASGQMRQSQLSPGTEEDFTTFLARVQEKTNDFSVELDLNLSYFPPSCSLGFGLSYSFSESELSQHVTSKVVHQVSYLLSTTTTTDGITQTTENLAFDKNTGDPVLTRTYDGYQAPTEKMYTKNDKNLAGDKIQHEGYYYSLAIPASWIYSSMGPKSSKADGKTNQLTTSVGNIVTYGKSEMYDDLSTNNVWSNTHPLTTVVNASATVYQNNWFTNMMASDYPLLNDLSTGEFNTVKTELNKHLYPYRSYIYRDDVKNANDGNVKIYNGGTMIHPFEFMNWGILNNGDNLDATHHDEPGSIYFDPQMGRWYSPISVVSYSPNGYPLEEEDVLGIHSTAKFGYGNTLPTLMAKNAKNAEVVFTDFELKNGFSGTTIDMNVTSEFAHSGQSSYNLTTNHDYNLASSYSISSDMITKNGLGIKLWLRSAFNGANNAGLKNQNPQLKALIGGQSFNCKKIAETGEWALYGVDIKTFNGLLPGNYDIRLSYNYNTGLNEKVLIDDVRIQPLNATMNCTVYTVDNKVATQFDDQHFGVFYEYNQKGFLVRKSIETERGKKTLQEQQYNSPAVPRNKQL